MAAVVRPFTWSVRRELWENRSIALAPLLVAATMLIGFAIAAVHLPERRRAALLLDEARQHAAVERPYDIAAAIVLITSFLVGAWYCLEALHGERRDRSVLFWKSLPVSDLTAVLSKASIPLLVLPPVATAVIVATQLLMVLMSTAVLLGSGLSFATIAPQLRFVPSPLIALYAAAVAALWHAPVYGWLLLVSAWARRAAFLWAVLPFYAAAALERLAFGTTHLSSFLRDRLLGWSTEGLSIHAPPSLAVITVAQLTPGRLLASPGLWGGLAFGAVCLAAAVKLRRSRGTI